MGQRKFYPYNLEELQMGIVISKKMYFLPHRRAAKWVIEWVAGWLADQISEQLADQVTERPCGWVGV